MHTCMCLYIPHVQYAAPYSNTLHKTSVWGPTCDGLDKICETLMPELDIGDWIYFDNMGAYTISASSSFNGFAKPVSYYYIREINRCVCVHMCPQRSPHMYVTTHLAPLVLQCKVQGSDSSI